MKVYFENLEGEVLCFNHAVKAVMEKDEEITAHAPDTSNYDMGGTGFFPGVCIECFPKEEEQEEELEED